MYMIFRPIANKLKSKIYELKCQKKENISVVRQPNLVFRIIRKRGGGVSPTRIDLNLKHIHWIYEIRGDVQTYREKGRWVII